MQPTSGKKIPAALLAILLGWLGIHKFYLGRTTAGIIQIVLSFVCGIGGLIGIVEGVIYLLKTDEDFDREYVTGGKDWF